MPRLRALPRAILAVLAGIAYAASQAAPAGGVTSRTFLANADATIGKSEVLWEVGMRGKPGEPTQEQKERREALLKEYGEICSNFRTLTDIRFRLLSLLPIAAAAVAALKPEGTSPTRLPFALFGLVVTLGLVTYNKRNDQLYDELVGRAAAIEREVGVPDGAFANRPTNWLAYTIWPFHWPVNHRRAVATVYFVTVAFWLYLAVEAVALVTARTSYGKSWLDWFTDLNEDLAAQRGTAVRAVLAIVVALATLALVKLLKSQQERRSSMVKQAVKEAVDLVGEAEKAAIAMALAGGVRENLPQVKDMVEQVWASPGVASGVVLRAASDDQLTVQAKLKELDRLASLCATASTATGRRDQCRAAAKIRNRIEFYSKLDAQAMRRYVTAQPGAGRAAQMVALLTDLPPGWIYDVVTGRRGGS